MSPISPPPTAVGEPADGWRASRCASGSTSGWSRGPPATRREQIAAAEIERIPTWPSWNSVFWTQSVRDHYAPIIRQVAAGDPTGVEAEMQLNCSWAAGE